MNAGAGPPHAVVAAGGRRPVRVLWLIKGLALGGAERLIVSFAEVADHERFDYEAGYVLADHADLVKELETAGVPTTCFGTDQHRDLRWLARLRTHLRSEPVDIVHVHLPYVAALAGLVVRTLPARNRPRIVYTQHSMWHAVTPPLRIILRLLLPAFDAIIAVSDVARRSMPKRLRDRCRVIVHGVPLGLARELRSQRDETRRELHVRDDEVVVTSIANFRPDKGHDVLLAAAKLLTDAGVPVRFLLVGHGELLDETKRLHHELGLDERVTFLGRRFDAMRILAASDLFVLASAHEGFPVSVMESLAVGVPVVATAVGGVPEAVTPGVEGLIVPPSEPAPLAAAIRRLVEDPDLRRSMARAAARRGGDFDMQRATSQFEALYLDLVGAAH